MVNERLGQRYVYAAFGLAGCACHVRAFVRSCVYACACHARVLSPACVRAQRVRAFD